MNNTGQCGCVAAKPPAKRVTRRVDIADEQGDVLSVADAEDGGVTALVRHEEDGQVRWSRLLLSREVAAALGDALLEVAGGAQ